MSGEITIVNNIVFVILVKDKPRDTPGRLFKRSVFWKHCPVEGDLIILNGSHPEAGWSERVRRRWFDVLTGEIMIEFRDIIDAQDEGLAESLLEAGWVES